MYSAFEWGLPVSTLYKFNVIIIVFEGHITCFGYASDDLDSRVKVTKVNI